MARQANSPQGGGSPRAAARNPGPRAQAYKIVKYALHRNHNINPRHVRLQHELRATYGLNEMEVRALDVPINDKLSPHNTFVTADECSACTSVNQMVKLVTGKLRQGGTQ